MSEDLYDIYVFPQERKDKLMYADQKSRIRVKGAPKQINPMEKARGYYCRAGCGQLQLSARGVESDLLRELYSRTQTASPERRNRQDLGEDHAAADRSARSELLRCRSGTRPDSRSPPLPDLLYRWNRNGRGYHVSDRDAAYLRMRRQ